MERNVTADKQTRAEVPTSRFIDWFAVGQGCDVVIEGATVSLRVVGQKGRRVRIAVVAPPAATFATGESGRDSSAIRQSDNM